MFEKDKGNLLRKYTRKTERRDELISTYQFQDEVRKRKDVFIMKTPDSNETRMYCPACIGFQIQSRMYLNKDQYWECSECHNSIDPSDLGLKPLSEDAIIAVNDPYRQPVKIYSPSTNLLQKYAIKQRDQFQRPKEGHYKMFKRKRFEFMSEAFAETKIRD